jgi:hypothetical protein
MCLHLRHAFQALVARQRVSATSRRNAVSTLLPSAGR